MKNLLVTGGAGFIGSNFIRFMLETEPDIHIFNADLLTYAGRMENLADLPDPARHTFLRGDIRDTEFVRQIFAEHDIDTVVHFAAESHVDRSILGPAPFITTNIIGTFNLLESARTAWADRRDVRFHHISTDEVFGALRPGDAPFNECTAYAPHSPYSASKASSDHLVRAYGSTYGLPITLSNCSNNYGPYQFPEKLIPLMILNGITGKALPVYGEGAQIRDWLHVKDHCAAIRLILRNGTPGETYCIGGDNQPSNLEIVKMICAILDRRFPKAAPHEQLIRFVKDRPGHDFRYDIDTAKIERELGWKPSYTLEDGLEETVDWYLSHGAWIDSVTGTDAFSTWMERNYSNRD